ncbi:MAG: hypothetical protein L0226_13155 [Acidobacteria bacterium]|nr:hypothetical protein [Acidobacteriota bacterium]
MTREDSIRRFVRLRLSLLATIMAALVVLPVQATIMQYLEVEDLTRLSSDIFHGQIISTETFWNAERTRIYTHVRVRIDEPLKGSIRRSEIITVKQLGGEKDGVRMDYAGRPEFSAGESVVLFTTRLKNNDLVVVALKQGKMLVEGDEVKRDFSGITLVERSSSGKNLQQITVKPSRMTIDELRNRIARTR